MRRVATLLVCLTACSSFREVDSGMVDARPDAALDTGWTLVYQGSAVTGESLNSIWVADRDHVFAVGDNGQSVWLEGGQWIELNKTKGLDLYGVWGRSSSEVYAVGRYELDQTPAIQYYDGDHWIALGPFPSSMTVLSDVWGTTGTKLYYTGLAGSIFASASTVPYQLVAQTGGCPDVADPAPVLWAIDGSDQGNVLVVGDDGLVAHRDINGWLRLCHPDKRVHYRSVFSVPGTTHFYLGASYLGLWRFTGRNDELLKIHEDRGTADGEQHHLWGIWGTSEARVIAVGDGGTILYFDGSGNGARRLPSPTSQALFGVSGADENEVYICGEGNRIWKGKLP